MNKNLELTAKKLVTVWGFLVDNGTELMSEGRRILLLIEERLKRLFGLTAQEIIEIYENSWHLVSIESKLHAMRLAGTI